MLRNGGGFSCLLFEPGGSDTVGGDVGRRSCGVIEGGNERLQGFRGGGEMLVEECFRDGGNRCAVREAGLGGFVRVHMERMWSSGREQYRRDW